MKTCSNRCIRLITLGIILLIMLGSTGFTLWKVYAFDQKGVLSEEKLTYTEKNGYREIVINEAFKSGKDILYVAQPNFIHFEGYKRDAQGNEVTLEPVWQFIYPFFDVSNFDQEDVYVLRIKGVVSASPVRMVGSTDFYALQGWLLTYMLFSIGIVFALFLLNVSFALILKDRNFKVYAIFLAFSQLYMFTSSGLSRLSIGLRGYGFMVFGFATLWMVLYFLRHYLAMSERLPCMDTISKYTMYGVALGIPMTLLSVVMHAEQFIHLNYIVLSILGGWVSFFTFVVLWRYLRKDYRLTPYFLTGSALQALTAIILIFALLEWFLKSPVYQISYMAAASINSLFFTLGMIEQLKDVREQGHIFYNLAITDKLTNAYNRYFFETQVHAFIRKNNHHGGLGVLVLVDIDYFKRVNDTYGHHVGDQVLQNLVILLQQQIRRTDQLFRWGGEEFVIFMEDVSIEQAIERCERIRERIASHDFPIVGNMTASFGVAAYKANESQEDWFKRCDEALYIAKETRNRVFTS